MEIPSGQEATETVSQWERGIPSGGLGAACKRWELESSAGLGEEEGRALGMGWQLCAEQHQGSRKEGNSTVEKDGGGSGFREGGVCLAAGTRPRCLCFYPQLEELLPLTLWCLSVAAKSLLLEAAQGGEVPD